MKMPQSLEPDVFEFSSLELLYFDEISLIWDDDVLIYYKGDEEKEFSPTMDKWKKFWRNMDGINAWEWQSEYTDKNVLDGETWSLHIIYKNNELKCIGTNAYPDGFKQFMRQLKLLIS